MSVSIFSKSSIGLKFIFLWPIESCLLASSARLVVVWSSTCCDLYMRALLEFLASPDAVWYLFSCDLFNECLLASSSSRVAVWFSFFCELFNECLLVSSCSRVALWFLFTWDLLFRVISTCWQWYALLLWFTGEDCSFWIISSCSNNKSHILLLYV